MRLASVGLAILVSSVAAGCAKSSHEHSTCGSNAPVATITAPGGGATPTTGIIGAPLQLAAAAHDLDQEAIGGTPSACGTPIPQTFSYRWTLLSVPAGSSARLNATDLIDPSFTPDLAGTYAVQLVVTDQTGLSSAPATATMVVSACGGAAPVITSLSLEPGALVLGAPVSVSASASDADNGAGCNLSQGLSYAWSLASRPATSSAVILDPSAAVATFVPDVAGSYQVALVVTDSTGLRSAPRFLTVVPGACTDGPQIADSGAQPLAPADLFSADEPGAPAGVFYQGNVVTLHLPAATTGHGGLVAGSCSPTVSYEWSMIGRPAGSAALLSSPVAATPSFVADVAGGTYTFALVVRDGIGNASAPYAFALTASACGTFAPSLPAGSSITYPANARANLSFDLVSPAAIDGNGPGNACPARFQSTPFTYAFSVAQAPASAATSLAQTGGPTAALLVNQGGMYAVQVIATDARGHASAPLTTPISVSACGANPPVATAFTIAQSVPGTGVQPAEVLPTYAGSSGGGAAGSTRGWYLGYPIAIGATVSDADSGPGCATFSIPPQTVQASWSLLSAPPGSLATLGATGLSGASLTPDLPGAYTLSLTTTDDLGDTSTSTLSLFQVSCVGSAPMVASLVATQAGGVQTPSDLAVGTAVQLGATVLDPDAVATGACTVAESQPLAYQWTFTSVPPGSAATVLAASTLGASFVPDVPGAYALSLTATDPQGHSTSSAPLVVNAVCGAAPPSVRPVGGSGTIPEFAVTQVLSVNGGTADQVITHSSDPAQSLAAGVSTVLRPLYPRVPAQLTARVLGTAADPIPPPPGTSCAPVVVSAIGYKWSLAAQPAGSKAKVENPTEASPSFTPDLPGTYDFQLVLTDPQGRSTTTLLAVDTAAAHPGQVGSCGTNPPAATLNVTNGPVGQIAPVNAFGSVAADDYRTPGQAYPAGCGLTQSLTYAWTLTQVPPGSSSSIASPSLVDPSFTPDLPGTYGVQVTVSDGANSVTRTGVFTADGFVSTPAAVSQALTAMALDASGNPVVASWDNVSGRVVAQRCTANCGGPSPTWTSLGTVDSGLGPMAFSPEDAPRPVAVLVSGGTTLVAYYTGHQPGTAGATTTGAMPFCSLVLASSTTAGTWSSYRTIATGTGCDASAFGGGTQSGRYVSLAQAPGGIPVIAYWRQLGSAQSEPHYVACSTTNCTGAPGTDVAIISSAAGQRFGRWVSVQVEASGQVNTAWYVDDNGSGQHFPAYSSSPSFSAPGFASVVIEPPSASDVGRFTSIVQSPPNTAANPSATRALVVAYRDASARTARFARCTTAGACGTGFTAQAVTDTTPDFGRDVVLAVDPATGFLRMAYLDVQDGLVRVLEGDGANPFTPIDQFLAFSAPGLSIAYGGGTRIAFATTTGALRFFAGP